MKLYLLACQNIQSYADRILPQLPEQRRAVYTRSRSPLSLGAGLLLSALLGARRDEDLITGPYGKPFLSAGKPAFSLAHSGVHVLLGVSEELVGVDMERKDRHVAQAVRDRICLPKEKGLDPLQVFTRKECAMKLTGLGFSLPLQQIDTTTDFIWQGILYRFFTTEKEGCVISVLTAEEELSEVQLLTPSDLL